MIFSWVYLGEAVARQVQCAEQNAALQTLHAGQVVVGAVQVEEGGDVPQPFGADELVVIHRQSLQPHHGLQAGWDQETQRIRMFTDLERWPPLLVHDVGLSSVFRVKPQLNISVTQCVELLSCSISIPDFSPEAQSSAERPEEVRMWRE